MTNSLFKYYKAPGLLQSCRVQFTFQFIAFFLIEIFVRLIILHRCFNSTTVHLETRTKIKIKSLKQFEGVFHILKEQIKLLGTPQPYLTRFNTNGPEIIQEHKALTLENECQKAHLKNSIHIPNIFLTNKVPFFCNIFFQCSLELISNHGFFVTYNNSKGLGMYFQGILTLLSGMSKFRTLLKLFV